MTREIDILVVEPGKAPRPARVVDTTDSRDFIAGTFLLCSFEGEHFASLSPAQQKEFEAYFALPDEEGGFEKE